MSIHDVPVRQQAWAGPGCGCRCRPACAHRHAPAQQAAEVLLAARWSTGRPPVSVTRLVPVGSTTMREAADLGRERRGRRRMSLKVVSAAADQEQQAGVGRHPSLACAAGLDEAAVARSRRGTRRRAPGGRRSPVGGVRRRRRRTPRTRRARRARRSTRPPTSPTRSPRVGPGRGRSSTTIVAWLRRVSRYWRTSRLDSPLGGHHLGRGAPVDVAQVVAGDVLAQRVEGEVALADRRRSRRPRGRAAGRRRASPAAPSAGAPAPRARASTPRRARRCRPGRRDGSSPARPGSRRGARCGW